MYNAEKRGKRQVLVRPIFCTRFFSGERWNITRPPPSVSHYTVRQGSTTSVGSDKHGSHKRPQ